jgi:hypothetical protein
LVIYLSIFGFGDLRLAVPRGGPAIAPACIMTGVAPGDAAYPQISKSQMLK